MNKNAIKIEILFTELRIKVLETNQSLRSFHGVAVLR